MSNAVDAALEIAGTVAEVSATRRVPRTTNGEGASAPSTPDMEMCHKHNVSHSVVVPCFMCEGERLRAMDKPGDNHAPDAAITAPFILLEASSLVSGSRESTHGDKLTNHQCIADLWNGYWRGKCRVNLERVTTPFTALDVANMMELLKIARRHTGTFNLDDYIDGAGYAAVAGEIAAHEHTQTTHRP